MGFINQLITGGHHPVATRSIVSMDWFVGENLQETMVFTIKLIGLSCKFSHHPILWFKGTFKQKPLHPPEELLWVFFSELWAWCPPEHLRCPHSARSCLSDTPCYAERYACDEEMFAMNICEQSPCSRGQSSKYMPMFHRFHRFHSYVSDLGRVSGNWWQLAGKPLIIQGQLVGVCPTPWCQTWSLALAHSIGPTNAANNV